MAAKKKNKILNWMKCIRRPCMSYLHALQRIVHKYNQMHKVRIKEHMKVFPIQISRIFTAIKAELLFRIL